MRYIDAKPISDGIAVGKALIKSSLKEVRKESVVDTKNEKARLRRALSLSARQLDHLRDHLPSENMDAFLFIEAHALIVRDPQLMLEVENYIDAHNVNAEYAFTTIIEGYIKHFSSLENAYLSERALDVSDIKQRVLNNFFDMSLALDIAEDTILFVDELYPSALINISKKVKGIVAKKGGPTSHSAILCNALGIPHVIANTSGVARQSDVIVDGTHGVVILDADESTLIEYEYLMFTGDIDAAEISFDRGRFKLDANISANRELNTVISNNCDGIGLYRTEYLFMAHESMPDEATQATIYHEALVRLEPKPVVFRTFDIGDDKKIDYLEVKGKGIENYRLYREVFDTQIRAMLRADSHGNGKIMFPMITSDKDFNELKERVKQLATALNKPVPPLGIMLETKAALNTIATFKDVDFISIGTNDLIYDLYGVKRDEASLNSTILDDLIARLVPVVKFADDNDIDISVCGELAANPKALDRLVSIGLRHFSVSINNIKHAESVLRRYMRT